MAQHYLQRELNFQLPWCSQHFSSTDFLSLIDQVSELPGEEESQVHLMSFLVLTLETSSCFLTLSRDVNCPGLSHFAPNFLIFWWSLLSYKCSVWEDLAISIRHCSFSIYLMDWHLEVWLKDFKEVLKRELDSPTEASFFFQNPKAQFLPDLPSVLDSLHELYFFVAGNNFLP